MAGLVTAWPYTGGALEPSPKLTTVAVQLAALPFRAECPGETALLGTLGLVKPTVALLAWRQETRKDTKTKLTDLKTSTQKTFINSN